MAAAYGVTLAACRTLSLRTIVIAIVVMHAILLLSPPLQLTDVFNYLGYARLGGLHHLNPYTHVISGEIHDPVFRFATWHGLHSPYGPLFTAVSYLLPFGSLSAAYWLIRWPRCSRAWAFWRSSGCAPGSSVATPVRAAVRGGEPDLPIFAVGGFHNDFFMLIPAMGAIALPLARRYRGRARR